MIEIPVRLEVSPLTVSRETVRPTILEITIRSEFDIYELVTVTLVI
jgi:hypothetical protein